MMQPYVDAAKGRERGQWFPGLNEDLIRLCIAAGLAFGLGLISFFRRERLWWVATMPSICGGLFVFWIAVVTLGETGKPVALAIGRSPDLILGILLALIGVASLARTRYSAKVAARVAQEQGAGGVAENAARVSMILMKLTGVVTLPVGISLILMHAFDLL